MMEGDRYLDDPEDEMNEDLEAMLYSQIHYGYSESAQTMSQESSGTQEYSVTSSSKNQFSVTPLSSGPSMRKVAGRLSAVKRTSLFESVPFDSGLVAQPEKTLKSVENVSAVKISSFQNQTTEGVHPGKSKVGVKTCDPKQPLKAVKPKFNLEAELGIHDSSPQTAKLAKWDDDCVQYMQTKKSSKEKRNKDTLDMSDSALRVKKDVSTKKNKSTPIKSSTTKLSKSAAALTPAFIKINKRAPINNDYRKTLGRLLTKKPGSKKVRDVVVVKSNSSVISISDTASTSSSGSSSEGEDASKVETLPLPPESSSASDSDSDIAILGSSRVDRAPEPKLELNWNITAADHQTVNRIERESLQEDDSKWRVDDADTQVLSRYRMSRYYAKKQIRCHNCDKEGHHSKVCPEPRKKPRCGLCGTEGHLMQRCPNSLCFNCNQSGHRGSNCPLPRRDRFARCPRCLMKGHTEDYCPDLWRQYHLTVTSSEDLTPSKRAVNFTMYCSNCARQGHYAHECKREKMDRHSLPTTPFVMKYDCTLSRRGKGPSQNKVTLTQSEQRLKGKKLFDSDTPHSYTPQQGKKSDTPHSYTPQQSQAAYPQGSSGRRTDPRNQRYFSAQSSTPSLPRQTHPAAPSSSHRARGQQQEVSSQPQLSPFTSKFLKGFLREDLGGGPDCLRSGGDQYFDWNTPHSSPQTRGQGRKRQSPGTWYDAASPPEKKKKGGRTNEAGTSQRGRGGGGWKGNRQQKMQGDHCHHYNELSNQGHNYNKQSDRSHHYNKQSDRSHHYNKQSDWSHHYNKQSSWSHHQNDQSEWSHHHNQQYERSHHHNQQSSGLAQNSSRNEWKHRNKEGKHKRSFSEPGDWNQQGQSWTDPPPENVKQRRRNRARSRTSKTSEPQSGSSDQQRQSQTVRQGGFKSSAKAKMLRNRMNTQQRY